MVAEDRVGEVIKIRFTGFTPVLLSVFACGSSLDDLVASAVDARHRLARFGETVTFKKSFTCMEGRLEQISHPSLTGR